MHVTILACFSLNIQYEQFLKITFWAELSKTLFHCLFSVGGCKEGMAHNIYWGMRTMRIFCSVTLRLFDFKSDKRLNFWPLVIYYCGFTLWAWFVSVKVYALYRNWYKTYVGFFFPLFFFAPMILHSSFWDLSNHKLREAVLNNCLI